MILFASDLDNTLLRSHKKITGEAVCVEYRGEKEQGFMRKKTAELLPRIAKNTLFVPITAREAERYQRIEFFQTTVQPEYALVANGGLLLHHGQKDGTWWEETQRRIAPSQNEMEKAGQLLASDPYLTLDLRKVEDVFYFTKTSHLEETMTRLSSLSREKLVIEAYENKIYIFPKGLDKGTSLQRFQKYLGLEGPTIAAGDTLMDLPMMEHSDLFFFPKTNWPKGEPPPRKLQLYEGEPCGFSDFIIESLAEQIKNGNLA